MFYKYLRANVNVRNLPRVIIRDSAIRVLTYSSVMRRFKISASESLEQTSLQKLKATFGFNNGESASSMALFSHWEEGGKLSEPDLHTISLLKKCGFHVVVVTTALSSTKAHDYFWERYSSSIDGLISRRNTGFDFGSWQEGLAILREEKIDFDESIFINNSLYPIAEDLSPFIEKLRSNTDVGGLIWSNEFRKHIQSFFLYFSSKGIHSEAFEEFWRSAQVLKDPALGKRTVVTKFELTWADYFSKDDNLRVDAIFEAPSKSVRNPMTFYWKELIKSDFPFIKKSLFVQNYEKIDMSNWKSLVANKITNDSIESIAQDIEDRLKFRVRKAIGSSQNTD